MADMHNARMHAQHASTARPAHESRPTVGDYACVLDSRKTPAMMMAMAMLRTRVQEEDHPH